MNLTRRFFCAGLAASATAAPSFAADAADNAVSGSWDPARLTSVLAPYDRWRPYPRIEDRAAWSAIPADVRDSVLAEANAYAGKPWGDLPATLFLEFKRTGNRSHYEDVSFPRRARLSTLVLAECLQGKGEFLDEIANGIWNICEESFWGVPASFPNREGLPDVLDPTLELFAGETVSTLAWTDYLLHSKLDTVSTLLRKRIRLESERRVIAPGLAHDDYGWMGLRSKAPVNNWNPWISSNWLAASLLLDADPQRRIATVHKIMRCLDRFLAGYAPDGGCDEGPGYWGRAGASLFEALEWLRSASNGAIDLFSLPLVAEIGRYIYRAHIGGQWFVNFADAPAKFHPLGDVVYRFGRAIHDKPMMAFGAWGQRKPFTARESLARALPGILNAAELKKAEAFAPLPRDHWFAGMQVMIARSDAGTTKGLFIAAQGGHNAESHNHNDVGNFIVYADGEPAIIDIGVERYTAKTFSAQRYEIWTMQSGFHNCPTVNGVMQAAGRQYQATAVDYRPGQFTMDLAKAYPAEAGIRTWNRSMRLDRTARRVEISDSYALNDNPRQLSLTLMTSVKPQLQPGRIELPSRAKIVFDPVAFKPRIEEFAKLDPSLAASWGGPLYRILLEAEAPKREGRFDVRIEQ